MNSLPKYERGVAGAVIERGWFVQSADDGLFYPDDTLRGVGGMARKPYDVNQWPPPAIQPGEEFEMMVSGGAKMAVGSRGLWMEFREGRCRPDLLVGSARAEFRLILGRDIDEFAP